MSFFAEELEEEYNQEPDQEESQDPDPAAEPGPDQAPGKTPAAFQGYDDEVGKIEQRLDGTNMIISASDNDPRGKRTLKINLRVNGYERDLWTAIAEDQGRTIAGLVRSLMEQKAKELDLF